MSVKCSESDAPTVSDVEWIAADEHLLAHPPKGCAVRDEDGTTRVLISARHLLGGIAIGGFAAVWNVVLWSILWLFLFNEETQYSGRFGDMPNDSGDMDPLGVSLVFGLPILVGILVGLGLSGAALYSLCGRVELLLDGDRSRCRMKIGEFTLWSKRFVMSRDSAVNSCLMDMQEGPSVPAIELASSRPSRLRMPVGRSPEVKVDFAVAVMRRYVRSLV